MQKILITALISGLLLAGCAHKVEIQQGNVVTQPQLEQLHTGMDKRQIRALLGSPLLIDPFHPDRWDYYYSLNKEGKTQQRYRLTLYFRDNRLERFEREGAFPQQEYQRTDTD